LIPGKDVRSVGSEVRPLRYVVLGLARALTVAGVLALIVLGCTLAEAGTEKVGVELVG
jgi:hypothetical protein